jgi:hypothetical protein
VPLSLLYLLLPYVIFFFGWLKWYFALLCVGLTLLPLSYCIREIDQIAGKDDAQSESPELRLRHIFLLLLVSIVLLDISGIGGYGSQDQDWLKHNAVLKDLIEKPWPVAYEYRGEILPIVYYIAFYLPAALFGKVGGWFLANQVLLVWSLIGLILAMLWFLTLVRRATATVILLFVAFSGLDVIGEWLITPIIVPFSPEAMPCWNWEHIEWWACGLQYSSNTTFRYPICADWPCSWWWDFITVPSYIPYHHYQQGKSLLGLALHLLKEAT